MKNEIPKLPKLVTKKVFEKFITEFDFYNGAEKLTENDAVVKGFIVDPKDAEAVLRLIKISSEGIKAELEPK
jgi:hypothetical protein